MARKKQEPQSSASKAEELEKRFALEKRAKPQQLYDWAGMAKTDMLAVEMAKLNEVAAMLWFPERIEEKQRDAQIVKALDLFNSIKPADGVEAMLAAQMVGTHAAAVECLRRAMIPDQTFAGRNSALSHAQRLMGLYTKQLASLDKHRGKGQQKVTVEHVHVESGGQAIVGHVEGARQGPDGSKQQPALEAPAEPVPDVKPKRKARIQRR